MTTIFVSWSGEPSLTVAVFLRDWLGNVMNVAEGWMSGRDIAAGALWSKEISDALSRTDLGVLCVTATNQESPWMNFEAGALAKALDGGRVIPYLIDLPLGRLRGPLQQFQAVTADEAGSLRLCSSVNEHLEHRLSDARLESSFAKWWPELDEVLRDLPVGSVEPARVQGRDQSWPMLKSLDSLLLATERLSAPQKGVLARISGDFTLGKYLFQLVQETGFSRAEVYYRCRDLERQELVEIETVTDSYFTLAASAQKLAQRDPDGFLAALQSPQRR